MSPVLDIFAAENSEALGYINVFLYNLKQRRIQDFTGDTIVLIVAEMKAKVFIIVYRL